MSSGYTPPLIGQAAARSQLLADMLKQNATGATDIKSGGELATRLLAQGVLTYGKNKADTGLREATAQDRQSQIANALAGLRGGAPAPTVAPAAPTAAPPPQSPISGIGQAPPATSQGSDNDALFNALIQQESGGRPGVLGPQTRYGQAQGMTQMLPGTAQEMAQKVGVPWRPELMTGTGPEAAEYQQTLGRAYLAEGLEKHGGDQRQALMYYHGGPDKRIWGPKTRKYADDVLGRLPQGGAQSIQIASNGAPPTPQQPSSAPVPTMGAGGAPPAAASPAAGGQTAQAIRPEEVALAERLLSDPRTFEEGRAYAMKLQQRQAEGPDYDVQVVNGLAFRIDPRTGQAIRVETPGTQTRPGTVDEAVGLIPGTSFDVKPTGERSILQSPPSGFQGGNGRLDPIRGGPQDPAAGQNLITGERTLREEYSGAVKDYSEARKGYEKVVAAANDGTPASDIALIFGFMKTLDPTSTVREGEYATAQNSGSIPENVIRAYNGAMSGDKLLPEKRAEFASTALNQYQVYERKAQEANKRYESMARSYGYDPTRIVQPIAPPTQPARPKAPAPADKPSGPTLDDVRAELARRRGAR